MKVEVNIGVMVDLSSLLQLRRRLLWFSLNTSYFSFIKIIRNLNETKFNLKLLKTMDSVLPKCGVQDWWDLRSQFQSESPQYSQSLFCKLQGWRQLLWFPSHTWRRQRSRRSYRWQWGCLWYRTAYRCPPLSSQPFTHLSQIPRPGGCSFWTILKDISNWIKSVFFPSCKK